MTKEGSDTLIEREGLNLIFKWTSIILTIFVFIVICFVTYLTYSANHLEIEEGKIKVTGHLGTEIAIEDVQVIELHASIPNIQRKVGGASMFNRKKGQFLLENLGRGHLYIHLNKPPFIYIESEDRYIYINSTDPTVTQEWYDALK
ncbi:MAG: hypothetical protein LPK26_15010 [Bacillaceae bacterium]|nr:hypothetical protein [Bacillaceae bacterium]